ncbi:hypothetical protein ES703_21923 [subsurface metagenome]
MNGAEVSEAIWLIGLSLAANGLLWNVRNAKGKTIGPPGSNFKKIEVEGPEAVELGKRRKGWSRILIIVSVAALVSWAIMQAAD